MIEQAPRGGYETDHDFHEFFFQSMSSNNQLIKVNDLDEAILNLKFQENFARHSDKIIDKTAGQINANGVNFSQMSQKLTSFQAKAGGRRRHDDARSEAKTIYGDNIDQSDV